MSRSTTSSDELGQWEDDFYRPHKKFKYSRARSETNSIEDDADSSTKRSLSFIRKPVSDLWVVTRCLGIGSNGSVYLAVRTADGDEYPLPYEMVIKSNQLSQSAYLANEEMFLNRLKSPFIVSFYGNVMTEEKNGKQYYHTIHEYCPGQCIAKHIKTHKGGLSIVDVRRLAGDILFGLKCLHGEEIIHCDIKPKNILLTPRIKICPAYGFKAKISGLGNAITKGWIESGGNWNHRSGTARFKSPELIGDKVLDYGADVWAFGCTVLEMLTGKRVWEEYGELDWEGWVTLIGKSGLVPCIPDYLPEKAKDFVTKCLERDPAKRWSVDSLIKHEFLIGEEDAYEDEDGDAYDEIEDAEVERYEANLDAEVAFEEEVDDEFLNDEEEVIVEEEDDEFLNDDEEEEEEVVVVEEEEAIEIDEEYPKDDSEEDL